MKWSLTARRKAFSRFCLASSFSWPSLCPLACKHKSEVLHLHTLQRGLQETTEIVLFPSMLGKRFHPKEPCWGHWLRILLVASAENVWVYRTLCHCHSGLTAPCIDQRWHQEKCEMCCEMWATGAFNSSSLCGVTAQAKAHLRNYRGGGIWIFL